MGHGPLLVALALAASAEASPPRLRLPDDPTPRRYQVTLTIDPRQPGFEGEVAIDLALAAPTSLVWLSAARLTVREARFEVRGETIAARVVPGGDRHVGFAPARPLGPGAARLLVAYTGRLREQEDHGVFRQRAGDDWYVLTQFQNTDARSAFPCLDEPRWKTPFSVTLRVPPGQAAFANTREVGRQRRGGLDEVRFAETRPLPTYLVAFAIGPFDAVPARAAGRGRTPVRVLVPRGLGARARYAAEATPQLLEEAERYFDLAYPYDKLDVIAIPQTVSFGAMENPGLVTMRQRRLLAAPGAETPTWKAWFAVTMAHELAHQWFGDSVTTAWWDDVWLNEGFASWMERKLIDRWRPDWRYGLEAIADRSSAMRKDGLVSARAVRQPIASEHDIVNAFDSITYTKGGALLSMFEALVGPERFQRGIRRYLTSHADRTATSRDFLAAMSAEAGRDLGPAFLSFLDRPGVPVISAEARCDGAPRATLRQQRWLPAGSSGDRAVSWQVPICVRWGTAAGPAGRACTLLDRPAAELPLASCPDWLVLNEGAAGYYRSRYDGKQLDALRRSWRHLALAERVALVGDVQAMYEAGHLPGSDVLALVPHLVADRDPSVLAAVLALADHIDEGHVAADARPALRRWFARTFGAAARALGWRPRPGEDDVTRVVRAQLLELVARRGDDPDLLAEAAALGRRWLDDRSALDGDLVGVALAAAARRGDRPLLDRVRRAIAASRDPGERNHLLHALFAFRDPALIEGALGLAVDGTLDVGEALLVVEEQDAANLPAVFAFITRHFEALLRHTPENARARLARVGAGFCDAEHRREVERFFAPRLARLEGGPRSLSQALERIDLCTALRASQGPSLSRFLAAP